MRISKKFTIIFLMVATGLLMVISGCSTTKSGSTDTKVSDTKSSSTDNTSVDLSYVKKQIDQYKTLPKFIPPGPEFKAKEIMAGKSIFSIPSNSSIPFDQTIEDAMETAAKKVGFNFTSWNNQGQPSQWVQGINQAINQKVSLIDLMGGTNPSVLGPQIEAAKKKGIKVLNSHSSGFEQSIPFVTQSLAIDLKKAGRLLADWAILKTNGHPNVVVITSNEIVASQSMVNGINDEFKTYSPGAKVKVINVPITDWATKIQTNVQTAVTSDSNINYILPIYDSMSQFVVPALTTTGTSDRIKIATFNGTPFVLDLVKQGKVEMDIGEDLDWVGWAILDDAMRMAGGLEQVTDEKMPFYIWDSTSVNAPGIHPPSLISQGNNYVDGYSKLWGLTQ